MADSPDDEVTIPRAALNKMMKEILPHVRVAGDARELILNCCTEFVHLISSEANEICNKQMKKTISPEHVLAALESLGFGAYMTDCKSALEECKTVAAKKRRGSNRLENLGIPEEELLRQQQELFEKARLEQAAIEHQEWLQLQAAQMQQQVGQFLPGMPPLPSEQTLPGPGAAGLPFQVHTTEHGHVGQISEQPGSGQDRLQTGSDVRTLSPSDQPSLPSGFQAPLANASDMNTPSAAADTFELGKSSVSSGEISTVPSETAELSYSTPVEDASKGSKNGKTG